MRLMPHQVEGVEFLVKTGGRAFLADEMGLGKTATVLSYLNQEKLTAVVVTTKSFLFGWGKEALVWYPGAEVLLVDKSVVVLANNAFTLLVTTYDLLWRMDVAKVAASADCVVFDESHRVANRDSKRSKAARELAASKTKVICLSGTPQPNGQPQQLWHQLLLVFPKFLSWKKFAERYCDAKKVWAPWADKYVWDTTGASNVEELKQLMAPRFLRRTKDLLNLPALTTEWLTVPVYLEREPDEPWKAYEGRLALKKVSHTVALVRDCLERGSKVLVFTNSVAVRDAVHDEFSEALCIQADMGWQDRAWTIAEFQHGTQFKVLTATTQIAAEGITLTAADVVVFNDVPWSPGLLDQAQSRAHRKGQTKPVHVYYLQSESIYDKVVRGALEHKQEVTDRLLEEQT